MLTERNWLLIGIAVVLLIGIGALVISCTNKPPSQSSELWLSDYPRLFEKDAMIIVGENATQVENEAAEAIAAKLEELTGNEPIIKKDSEVSENDKRSHNLVLVGIPNSNSLLQEVYDVTDATKVTEEYPGDNKGILQILRNPWNSDKALLIVAGSDEWGVKAGSNILQYTQELDKSEVVVDWKHLAENKQAVVLGLTPSEFKVLDEKVHEYFFNLDPELKDLGYFPVLYERAPELEDRPGLKVVKADARFMDPSPTVIFGIYEGRIYLM